MKRNNFLKTSNTTSTDSPIINILKRMLFSQYDCIISDSKATLFSVFNLFIRGQFLTPNNSVCVRNLRKITKYKLSYADDSRFVV